VTGIPGVAASRYRGLAMTVARARSKVILIKTLLIITTDATL